MLLSADWETLIRRLPRMELASSKKSRAPVSDALAKAALMFLPDLRLVQQSRKLADLEHLDQPLQEGV
jgi:hypothetical protein